MSPTEIVRLIGEVMTLLGIVVTCFVAISKVINGQKCLLRSEMLRIYYHNRDKAEIRQYEYENFVLLYEAYKRLKGNSFIDKIYKEMQSWKVIS